MQTNRAVPPQGKAVYYRSDGTGRDTYIRDHNGGLLSHDRIHKLKQPKQIKDRKFNLGKTVYGKDASSYRFGGSNKFPHYISDGSGRDFYVKNTQGGNSTPFRWRDQNLFRFKDSLRSYNRIPNLNPEKQDVFMKTQTKLTDRQSRMSKATSMYQQSSNNRLSEPKKTYKPATIQSYFDQDFDGTRIEKTCTWTLPQARRTFCKG